jgi:hypothetical protein
MSKSPGEYLNEKDLSQRVRAVSSTIGAIALESGKGEVMKRVFVTNKQEFIEHFGKPNPAISRGHYAALTFLEKASRLYVVRVINDDESKGARPLTAGVFFSIDEVGAKVPVPRINNFAGPDGKAKGMYDPFNTYTYNPNTPGIKNVLFMLCAANPGVWNDNIYVQVRNSRKALVSDFDEAYDDPTRFYIDVYLNYRSKRQTPDESFLVSLKYESDGYGNQLHIEEVINSSSRLIRARINPYAAENVKILSDVGVQFEGGTNGAHPNYTQMMAGWESGGI